MVSFELTLLLKVTMTLCADEAGTFHTAAHSWHGAVCALTKWPTPRTVVGRDPCAAGSYVVLQQLRSLLCRRQQRMSSNFVGCRSGAKRARFAASTAAAALLGEMLQLEPGIIPSAPPMWEAGQHRLAVVPPVHFVLVLLVPLHRADGAGRLGPNIVCLGE